MERLQSLLNYNRYQFLSSDPTHFKTSGEPFGTFPKTKTRGRCRKKNKRVVVVNWEASKKYCVGSQQRVEKQKLPEPKISAESTKKTKSK